MDRIHSKITEEIKNSTIYKHSNDLLYIHNSKNLFTLHKEVGFTIRYKPSFLLDDFEIKDTEHDYSYTVNTIQYLYSMCKEIEGRIGLIIGADLIQGFHKWHKVDTIVDMADVIAVGRGEANNLDPTVIAKYSIKVLELAKQDTSSTMVRSRVQAGLSIKGLVCDEVRDYILEHGLYV